MELSESTKDADDSTEDVIEDAEDSEPVVSASDGSKGSI